MHDYCLGLLMPIDRKSVEPMAAVTAPGQVAAKHHLVHFGGAVVTRELARGRLDPAIEARPAAAPPKGGVG